MEVIKSLWVRDINVCLWCGSVVVVLLMLGLSLPYVNGIGARSRIRWFEMARVRISTNDKSTRFTIKYQYEGN